MNQQIGQQTIATPISANPTKRNGMPRSGKPPDKNMAWIPSGTFTMGSDHHYPEEAPAHPVTVSGFWMDQYAVTNKQFQRFVKATGYITVAERSPKLEDYPGALPELLVAGSLVFQQPHRSVDLRTCWWWSYVPGANWRHPEGPGSSIKKRDHHPVVHIAYEDAEAYATWIGKALPTEAQWELAARGGLEGTAYPWGDDLMPHGNPMANVWQGEFPWQNLKAHPPGSEPVGSYSPNAYGLYEMVGNVWEWTADWYRSHPAQTDHQSCCIPENPNGGALEASFDPEYAAVRIPRKVLKGGSFLCAANYCSRYRSAARHAETVDTSTCHIGFRCVVNGSTR